ncbi:MAG: ribbon-helix-helix protein, CopG family [Candidatus Marinimicrobia bacterium]|nr:ribbon-helix-helix protein, CopG family [Candidatus Neomarinimicrobiota bacterium]MBT4064962.1 ribbon-helix-helix protein, CopG family [Candidatus Neomarinimicrobiota bacterium]MBT4178294.1 ribbon-helix-helix protein, CopG family [Candidatus Neomarinimicrobiota bacterium]MBT7083864.1 ribbon-helix-helix protein, CopG family [Candidatus Neomarinimicrobiota bacterium]
MSEKITITLPKSMITEIDQFAGANDINKSRVVLEALRQYLTLSDFRKLRQKKIPIAEKMA